MADETKKLIGELVSFLSSPRQDLRSGAVENLVGLTASDEGRSLLQDHDVIRPLVRLIGEPKIAKDVMTSLVNLSADENLIPAFLERDIISPVIENMKDFENLPEIVELDAMLLINLTIHEEGCVKMLDVNGPIVGYKLFKLLDMFIFKERTAKDPYSWIGPILQNVTQVPTGRSLLLNKERNVIPLLIPFLKDQNERRKKSILAVISNCSFDSDEHSWILTETDLVPSLMMLLRGPEILDAEDLKGMHPILHNPQKSREPDHECRKFVLDILLKMCKSRNNRKTLCDIQVYPILREYEKVEEDSEMNDMIHTLVDQVMLRDYVPDTSNMTSANVKSELMVSHNDEPVETKVTKKEGTPTFKTEEEIKKEKLQHIESEMEEI